MFQSYVLWLYISVVAIGMLSLWEEILFRKMEISIAWLTSPKRLSGETSIPTTIIISNESKETSVDTPMIIKNESDMVKVTNCVQILYYLAEHFTELSLVQKFVIGRDMKILEEEDTFLPLEDIEDLIFINVAKQNRYRELLRNIHKCWHAE